MTCPIPFDMFDKHTAKTSVIIQSHSSFLTSTLDYTNCGLRSKYGAKENAEYSFVFSGSSIILM